MSIYAAKALREQYSLVYDFLKHYVEMKGIEFKEIDSTNLWCRDYMPVKIRNDYVKFKYLGYNGYPQMEVSDDCWKPFNVYRSDIVLDGGNVVQNDDCVFITEQVFKNNPHLLRNDLIQFLKDTFDKRLIFIPVEPGDELGHADGIIKFVNDKVVLVNDYRAWINQTQWEYAIRLEAILMRNKFDIIRLPWAYQKMPIMSEVEFRKKYSYADDFNPGFGYYINYYQFADVVLMPTFGIGEDVDALICLKNCFPECEVVPVDCRDLSMLGGLMNCVTWED